MASLLSLPPEITRDIFTYLPVGSLLSFGQTSKRNHAIQSASLSTLRLAVFPSRLGCSISLMEASAEPGSIHNVQMVLSKRESRTKETVQTNQNARIQRVMDKYRHTLRDLEIALWELQGSSAASIARLTNLRRLSIRLDHPHTRHLDVDGAFWETASGSTVWNKLSARPGEERVFGRLQSLKLERAGLTDYQLRLILESNSSIEDLRLQKCLALTESTFGFLAANGVAESFKVFHFTRNPQRAYR